MTAEELIEHLGLSPHPEGGYFAETYRAKGEIRNDLPEGMKGVRNYATSIYFLLTSEKFSAFHRIHQDEIWHYYQGSPIDLHIISDQGHETIKLGQDLVKGEVLQAVVPAGDWFAAEVLGENTHALVGCTVAPGFDFQDFELAKREDLIQVFPDHAGVISRFTRK